MTLAQDPALTQKQRTMRHALRTLKQAGGSTFQLLLISMFISIIQLKETHGWAPRTSTSQTCTTGIMNGICEHTRDFFPRQRCASSEDAYICSVLWLCCLHTTESVFIIVRLSYSIIYLKAPHESASTKRIPSTGWPEYQA